MSPPIHKEFITTLKEIDSDFDNILLGTYGFDCAFFEDVLLNIFQSKDASTIISLIDRSHYESTFKSAKNAGVSYFIEPISHRLFHPKFVLMTSEFEGTLIVSSANMTKNGLTEDAEIFTLIKYTQSENDKTVLSLFFEMKEFLKGLVTKGYIKSDKHIDRLNKTLQVPWLNQSPIIPQRTDWILHNLDNGILKQTKEILSGTEVRTIKILSPFFDTAGTVLKYITRNFSGRIELYLQPDRAYNVPTEVIDLLANEEKKLKVYKASFKGSPNRFIHAKVIIFETDRGTYCLTGSANSTSDALMLNSNSGNIELSLLQYNVDKTAFQYLLNNNELILEQIFPNELTPNIGGMSSNGETSDFYLDDARLEGSKLILEFEPTKEVFEKAFVEINSPSKTKSILLNGRITENGQFVENLSEETSRYCEQSAYVTLTLTNDASCKIVSNKRWISTEMLEKFPRKREIRLIEKTHGRAGFITLLNRLDDAAADIPTMLLYYLRFLDFGILAETLDEARARFIHRTGEEGLEDSSQIYDGFVLDATDVLKTILSRNEKRFVELTEEVMVNQDLEERVRDIFDFFIFIEKIIIWFILRKNTSPSNVIEIIERMKRLVGSNNRYWYYRDQIGYFQKLKCKIGNKHFLKIIESLDVLPQFVLLSMIILKLVNSQPQERSFLKRHLTELLQNASFNGEEQTGLQSIPLEKMKKAIAEYKEFENLSFSPKDIMEINAMLKAPIKEKFCRACKKSTRYRINSEEFLCPECAKSLLKRPGEYFALTQCPKCGYRGWEKTQMKGSKPIQWCPRDGMKREETDAKFYLPV
ncbi:MAG: hypothetical protein NWE93_04670 [Candidatus Bathyarchaeota archaeon]|nr:hypothetical protein [Candidatus Bathyarchaeota archaeon]